MSHQEHFFLKYIPDVFTSPQSTVIHLYKDGEMNTKYLCLSFMIYNTRFLFIVQSQVVALSYFE